MSLTGEKYVSTVVHRIDSVTDPKTKKQITVNEAVEQGVIDEATGMY